MGRRHGRRYFTYSLVSNLKSYNLKSVLFIYYYFSCMGVYVRDSVFGSFLVFFRVIRCGAFIHGFKQPSRMDVEFEEPFDFALKILIQTVCVTVVLLTDQLFPRVVDGWDLDW